MQALFYQVEPISKILCHRGQRSAISESVQKVEKPE